MSIQVRRLSCVPSLACAAGMLVCAAGACLALALMPTADALAEGAAQGGETEGIENPYAEEYGQYTPRVFTNEYGNEIQQTPWSSGGLLGWGFGYSLDFPYYNNYVLNADARGCNSCHDLVDVVENGLLADGSHQFYLAGYPTATMNYEDSCLACHYAYGVNTMDFIHGHMNNETFKAMNGSCLSCHYIEEDGSMVLWDEVKYDVLKGITDVAADESQAKVTYTQDEITSTENMFTVAHAANGFEDDYVEHRDDIRDVYTVSFVGELGNPCELTIQEMIDLFGTEKRTMTRACTLLGPGAPLIFQAEVTGIPFNKVLDYLEVNGSDVLMQTNGYDGYALVTSVDSYRATDGLLVFEINGEELSDEQGYPLALWFDHGTAAGAGTEYLSEIVFTTPEDAPHAPDITNNFYEALHADYLYPYGIYEGELISTPNIGVLSAQSGQIFAAGELVHLEGYAYGFDEQVVKMEFSFDHGQTWVEVPVENADIDQWVYWQMDVPAFSAAGAYLVEMRVTSIDGNGEDHVCARNSQFLINVQ